MCDLIRRQDAIDAIEKNAYRHTYLDQIIDIIKALPSAQPEKRTHERTETHSCDLIDRQAAIDAIEILSEQSEDDEHDKTWNNAIRGSINAVKHHVPSAQPQLPEWAQKVEEYRKIAPKTFSSPIAWALYQTWREYAERRTDGRSNQETGCD